jgi:hypothetical protein
MRYWDYVVTFAVPTTSFGDQPAGNFGGSSTGRFGVAPKEQSFIEWLVSTYGDPRGYGTPTLIKPIISTSVVNDMPADSVTAFSKSTDKIFFWVFYMHFIAGDTITMNMVYTTNGQTVLSSSLQAGGEYGTASGSVSPPAGGWLPGDYAITFSGKGATRTVTFKVIEDSTITQKVTFTTNGIPVQSINVYIFEDASAVGTFSYVPDPSVQNQVQDIKTIATGIFGSVTGPVQLITSRDGLSNQSAGDSNDGRNDRRKIASAPITIPVDPRESPVTGRAYVTFGIPQFASVTKNETGTLYIYRTKPLAFPSEIAFTLRYFDTARVVVRKTNAFPSTTHLVQHLSNGNYLVYPIYPQWPRLEGEPIPGAEIYVELEPDDEPIIFIPVIPDSTLQAT